MFDLEFVVKQKAQLKYMQHKQSIKWNRNLFNMFQHEFLWSPTPLYYVGTFVFYRLIRKRLQLSAMHALPFLAIPPSLDYLKREYFVSKFPEDKKALKQAKQAVTQILDEKKA